MDENSINDITSDEAFVTVEENSELDLNKCRKIPWEQIATLGVALSGSLEQFKTIAMGNVMEGQSGLYQVTFPKGISGHLAKFHDGSGFTSAITQTGKGIQGNARLTPAGSTVVNRASIPVDPTSLFLAIAIASINQKLDMIEETQLEILNFLKNKEKAELRGNLITLDEIMKSLKYNSDNIQYKNNKSLLVQEIARESEKDRIFHREQIMDVLNKKQMFHINQDVNKQISKIQAEMYDYRISIYSYAYAKFLEVMLLGNYGKAFIISLTDAIKRYELEYRELYTKCYNAIEHNTRTSVEAHVLGGLSSAAKKAGEAISKTSIGEKSLLDETMIKAGEKLLNSRDTNKQKILGQICQNTESIAKPFLDNLQTVSNLYNDQVSIMMDKKYIYLAA